MGKRTTFLPLGLRVLSRPTGRTLSSSASAVVAIAFCDVAFVGFDEKDLGRIGIKDEKFDFLEIC